MFKPNRGGNLWSSLQSQGQEDRYESRHAAPLALAFTNLFIDNTMCMISQFQMKLWP